MPVTHSRGFSWLALLGIFRRLSLLVLLGIAFVILALQMARRDRLEALRDNAVNVLTPVLEVL
ncbi:MAG: hypothetical protein SFW65_10645, partial [Alphaproteobacteria bacterium]|nr:hypothetical protein [Alphaproteobacteria bacterium]